MRMIKLGIYLRNRQFAKDIARALAEIQTNLELTLLEGRIYAPETQIGYYDIILTDRGELRTYDSKVVVITDEGSSGFDEKYEKEGQALSSFANADEILNAVVRTCERNNHKQFAGNNIYSCKTIIFSSFAGGSGTSAAAITCGRLLASEYAKKVLYLNAGGSKGWKLYISDLAKPARPVREMPHLIQNGILQSFDSYVQRDKYGLSYLEGTEKSQLVLQKLCESANYEFIIVDQPPIHLDINFDHKCIVINDKDQRSRFCKDSATGQTEKNSQDIVQIVNRSPCAGWDEGRFKIPEDRDSFTNGEMGIEIAMDGYYAINIGKVCREWI